MFTSIEVENFRGFKHYGLKGFSRVNLLVGDNGSGKTSILEAIQILASGGSPGLLTFLANVRGEVVWMSTGTSPGFDLPPAPEPTPDLSHFFHGHGVEPGTYFRLNANGDDVPLTVRVAEPTGAEILAASGLGPPPNRALFVIRLEGGHRDTDQTEPAVLVSDSGVLWRVGSSLLSRRSASSWENRRDIQFISPGSHGPSSVSQMWGRIVVAGRESGVVDAMKIVAPHLKDIMSLGYGSGTLSWRTDGFLAALDGQQGRVPLGSLGDGVARLFTIATALVHGERGTLLFDEIDSGLHYSIMGDLWHLIVETSKRTDTQVFATTHSLDCVRGLAWLCDNYPDLRPEISLQKIDTRLQEAVSLDAENLLIVADQQIEVR